MPNRKIALSMLVAAAFVVLFAARPLTGQQAVANQDVLGALLVEVRGLRAAMEQMAAAGPRVQLVMGRLQLQEQRLNTMLRRLDAVREQKVSIERDAARVRPRLAELEEIAEKAEELQERKGAAAELRDIKGFLERNAIDAQRVAGEETELSNAIAAEQARWSDINRQLDELERALTRK